MSRSIAIVDCNNFYASCEVLFRPDWQGRPLVVASNNDGCVVARSTEAKALGIPMGAPLFKIGDLIHRHGVIVCSSNYTLYGDMSQRVMETLDELAPLVEVYSIDEAWLDLSSLAQDLDLEEYCRQIRTKVWEWIGLRVGIGLSTTKTLALSVERRFCFYAKSYVAFNLCK